MSAPDVTTETDERSEADKKPKRHSLGSGYRKVFSASVVTNLGDGVGVVAYPWLASALTRNPMLIAVVGVAQRLPWLVFSLPAGVITDRIDRRRAMVAMDIIRGVITAVVALLVLGEQDVLPKPDALDAVTETRTALYVLVLLATLLLGMAEVLRDNSAQTIMPAIVDPRDLEKANGRMWSAEGVANTFIGPPLGALLVGIAFVLPFLVDAASFFAAAALIATIPGTFRATRPVGQEEPAHWRAELAEGVRWLWAHPLLRPMAIILGIMNAAAMATGASFVLFAQEVLDVNAFLFAVVSMGGAIGGIIGGVAASWASKRFGSGVCLGMTLGGSAVIGLAMAFTSWWPVAFLLFAATSLLSILWNVITVSLRQTIIPEHLLGRVNSVYRFFAWGMMPIGAALGGVIIVVVDSFASRETALRSTWIAYAIIHLVLFVVGARKLTTERIESARAAAVGPEPA